MSEVTFEATEVGPWGTVWCGEALDVLRALPENTADAMVTDPPSGIDFMGLAWDRYQDRHAFIAAMAEVFTEARRVLKPGAHVLVWSLPKTSHWTATALEDADYEIRDVVFHIFGEGMPKSHDISKAIDARLGVERKVVGTKRLRDIRNGQGKDRYTNINAAMRPDDESPDYIDHPITEPGSPEAIEWSGWGTGLKPCIEGWILARAPLAEETIAGNVLAHGTGAINIDGTRIEAPDGVPVFTGKAQARSNTYSDGLHGSERTGEIDTETGRWPSNLAFSHALACTDDLCSPGCPIPILDEQGGVRTSGAGPTKITERDRNTYGGFAGVTEKESLRPSNTGTVSRYFPVFSYMPKPTPDERHAGTDGENSHPTLKGIELMRWLVKMVTPKKGVVLDPFFGSGTTGAATALESVSIIGIERQPKYAEIGAKRTAYWWQVSRNRPAAVSITTAKKLVRKPQKRNQDQLGLFD